MQGDKAAAAAAAAIVAENARKQAADAVKASRRAGEPITIFVSRKAGQVFIRQGWQSIHRAPVAFRDGPPLGTHVYLAMDAAAGEQTLSWLSVSLPPSAARSSRRRGRAAAQPSPAPAQSPETAAGALERFELSEATREFIADRLWIGATLIVSDNGISNETGKYTDIIVTR